MIPAAVMILAVFCCFLAAVLNLAVNSRVRRLTMQIAVITAVVTGGFFYGYGYAWCYGLNAVSLIRALLALCRMFGGMNDLGSIQAAPILTNHAMLTLFWIGHFMAFYVTASAAIATLGEQLLHRIRITLLRRGPLLLIYGINARSVAYGRRQEHEKRRAVLYVDHDYNPVYESNIQAFGGVVDQSTDALEANIRFLKQINMKPGKRRLELAALDSDGSKNLNYARKLLDTMTKAGIRPEQISLFASGIGEEAASLQALSGQGYGSVYAFDEYELTARQMILDHPPCDRISFDGTGKAAENFHAVILGFGHMGRAVLSQLVMNGQFHGSQFRTDIFDPGPQNGFLHDQPVTRQYDIRFHQADGTADAFYAFLKEHLRNIKMIVICTGSRDKNCEIAADVLNWFPRDRQIPLILHMTRENYTWFDENRQEWQSRQLFENTELNPECLDEVAMQVNQAYCVQAGSTRTAKENWMACSYSNRRSSRACADFYPAVLRASGRTVGQILSGDWPPQGEMMENLARTEHLRWCAFQYVSGYAPMPEAIWHQRAAQYRQGEKPEFRISRDDQNRLQACLIPWEELNELSARENEITGGQVDYQQMDRNNVRIVSEILQAKQRTSEG